MNGFVWPVVYVLCMYASKPWNQRKIEAPLCPLPLTMLPGLTRPGSNFHEPCLPACLNPSLFPCCKCCANQHDSIVFFPTQHTIEA